MANPQKENGHLDLANELVEKLAKTQLSGYESRILWSIWRKTYCWHKKQENINFDQFKELTEIRNSSRLSETIKRLIDRRIVTKNRKLYGFNKNYDEWISYGKAEVELRKSVTKVTEKRNNNRLLKETILKETIKKKKGTKVPEEVKEILNFFKETYQIKSLPNQLQNLGAARWLFNEKGLEQAKKAIIAAWSCRGQEYAPSINNLLDLRSKYGKLEDYYARRQNKKSVIG